MRNRHTPRFKPVKILLAMLLVSCKLQHGNPVGRSGSASERRRKRRVSPLCETAAAGMKEEMAAAGRMRDARRTKP